MCQIGFLYFSGNTLHQEADEVEGSQAHPHGLVNYGWAFHCEKLHALGGFKIPQFQLNLPTPGVEIGKFDAVLFPIIGKRIHKAHLAFFCSTIFVGEPDEADFKCLWYSILVSASL